MAVVVVLIVPQSDDVDDDDDEGNNNGNTENVKIQGRKWWTKKIQKNCIEIEIWQSKKFDAYQISLRILSVGVFLKELGRCNWHTQTKF